ncbi:MAG TPA: hypothetical protein VIK35_04515 [Verrucomicrobiae bacterium]
MDDFGGHGRNDRGGEGEFGKQSSTFQNEEALVCGGCVSAKRKTTMKFLKLIP